MSGVKRVLTRSLLWLLVIAGLLPVSMVFTLAIHPFWRWFEERTGIEAFGHFGPADWCYWLDYVLVLVLFFLTRYWLVKKAPTPSP